MSEAGGAQKITCKCDGKTHCYKDKKREKNEKIKTATDYLNKKIFPILLPAMEEMLIQAHQWNALKIQKCRFNGLDYLAAALWNRNPRHPKRAQRWLDVFEIPVFKLQLRLKPRPIYPKSWLWTEEEAAIHLQKFVRSWLVGKRADVQEMHEFWKIIRAENEEQAEKRSESATEKKEWETMDLCKLYKYLRDQNEKDAMQSQSKSKLTN